MVFFSFREEIEKQKSILRYKRLQEEGKTEQARKDLGEGLVVTFSTIMISHLLYIVLYFTLHMVDHDDIFNYIHVNTPQRHYKLEEMAYRFAVESCARVQVHLV
jgi:hypothetical protein